jgi:predicted helicase
MVIMVRSLRPNQIEATNAILNELTQHDKAILVSACGTGKTISLQFIANKISSQGTNKIVAFFPSLSLIDQTIKEWGIQYNWNFNPVVVCSDETIGKNFNDDIIINNNEFISQGVEVTRDPYRIRDIILEHNKNTEKPLVIFSTYQSSYKIAAAQNMESDIKDKLYFDIAISDEAHYLAGKVTDRTGAAVLDSKRILAKKRVFATATPKVVSLNSKNMTQSVVSMDDEKVFGRIAYNLGLRESINKGLLCDYKIYICEVSQTEAAGILGVEKNLDVSDADIRMALGYAAYKRMKKKLNVQRSIIYLSSRRRAYEFKKIAGKDVDVITGELSSEKRAPKLNKLRNEGGAIANVRCLTEGIDLPSLDAVEFIDPRSSKIDIIQALGRAIRKDDIGDKHYGYIVIPILEEPDDKDYGSGSTFKPLFDVLTQLASNDKDLEESLNTIVQKIVANDSKDNDISNLDLSKEFNQINKTIQLDSDRVDQFSHLSIANSLLNKIILKEVDTLNPHYNWYNNAKLCINKIKEFGKLPPKSKEYNWLQYQKRDFKSNNLSQDRIDYLNENLPGWNENLRRDWYKVTDDLIQTINKLGRFPTRSEPYGSWITRIRWLFKQDKLSQQQINYLDKNIKNWNKSLDDKWFEMADKVAKGQVSHDEESIWKGLQRSKFKNGELSKDRINYLNHNIKNWKMGNKNLWFEKADKIAKGQFNKEKSWQWVSYQRRLFRRGKLSQDRIDYLNENLPDWKHNL